MCLKAKGRWKTRIHIILWTWMCVASAVTLPGTPIECHTYYCGQTILPWCFTPTTNLKPYWGEQTSSEHRQMHTFCLWQLPTHWAIAIRQLSHSKPVSRGGSANLDYLIHSRRRPVCKQTLTVKCASQTGQKHGFQVRTNLRLCAASLLCHC